MAKDDSRLLQIKMNALSAKILHKKKLSRYNSIDRLQQILVILVPLFYLIPVVLTKGIWIESTINGIGVFLSILLLGISVLGLIFKVNNKIEQHKLGLHDNLTTINEVDILLNQDNTEMNLSWFYRYVNEIDKRDNELFASLKDREKQEAYRNALKEVSPGDINTKCPNCGSSPWRYVSGDCQLCGNSFTEENNQ